MPRPKVSIIMTVYNGEKYIAESMESLLNQTFKDFELVVVDDGSTDDTNKIVRKYDDKRIKLLENKPNKGSIYSRNRAVVESTGPFIAILDSDDIALPERLEKEVEFLDENPEFGVIGTDVELIDESGKSKGVIWKNRLPSEMIPAILLFQNYFANSGTMFRRDALPAIPPYRDMNPADDVDLWLRIDKKWKMWNIPHLLTKYRIHGNNMSIIDSDRGRMVMKKMITEALNDKLGIIPTDEEYFTHRYNYIYDGGEGLAFFNKRENWLKKLQSQNEKTRYYDDAIFRKVLADRWLTSCSSNTRFGMAIWKKFWKSDLSRDLDKKDYAIAISKFFIKCILKKDSLSLKSILK